jgi:hypothetical protein
VQVFHPDWSSKFCLDAAQAATTRRTVLQRAASEDLVLLPAHLRAASMRIAEKNGGFVPAIKG